jgi:hypothetical protein
MITFLTPSEYIETYNGGTLNILDNLCYMDSRVYYELQRATFSEKGTIRPTDQVATATLLLHDLVECSPIGVRIKPNHYKDLQKHFFQNAREQLDQLKSRRPQLYIALGRIISEQREICQNSSTKILQPQGVNMHWSELLVIPNYLESVINKGLVYRGDFGPNTNQNIVLSVPAALILEERLLSGEFDE